MIMAHDRPDHLARLINRLDGDWLDVFIHVDAKVPLEPFRAAIREDGRVRFLDRHERIAVNWGGFSSVEATLLMLRAALNDPGGFDRFCLLSGSDFPIASAKAIHDGFASNREFIRIDRRLDDADDNSHCAYVRYAHFADGPGRDRKPKQRRRVYDKISLYHGSQWWALTEACVSHILEYVERNPDYAAFHRNTLLSDEIFFHSIVKSSPFAALVSHDFEKASDLQAYFAFNEHGCHYIDWNSRGVRLPKVLDEGDFDRLIGSSALFARKFRDASEPLLGRIEEVIAP